MSSLFNTPDPPNPQATAAAQTGTNVATAVANANLGQVNQNTPQGNLSYAQTDTFNWLDPSTGQTYSIPKFTATQTLSPTGQATFDQSQQAQYNLAALGSEQSARLRQQFGTSLGSSLAGAPAFGDVNSLTGAPQAQTSFGTPGDTSIRSFAANDPTLGSFGAAPDIQQSYQHGDDFSADRQRIESGLMQRLDPSLAQERNKYEQQLADQGIRYGSPAYENAMRNYSMQANDARLAAIGQGGIEQQRLSDIARQAGEFYNKGQQQAYEQAKGRGEFANQAAQQQYEQAFGRGQFYNAGQQQNFAQEAMRGTFANAAQAQNFQQAQSAFNATNAARQQYLNEQFALRNQPINEISALLSGSQVSTPNFLNTGGPTIPTTDVAGLINRNFDQQMAASNQQAATANNIIGGLFGFAGGLGRGGAFTPR
jgi:hypothetical protein